MKRCPAIGARVQTRPTHRYGVITGTVRASYPSHGDRFDDEGNFVAFGPMRPESEWSVDVQVDVVPPNWSYVGTDRFAPQVSDLVSVRSHSVAKVQS